MNVKPHSILVNSGEKCVHTHTHTHIHTLANIFQHSNHIPMLWILHRYPGLYCQVLEGCYH